MADHGVAVVTMGLLWWPWCCCGGHGAAVVAMALPGVAVVAMVLMW